MLQPTNSWSITQTTDFSTNYHYLCSCGKQSVTHSNRDLDAVPEFICPQCHNDYFLDTDSFIQQQNILYWKNIKYAHTLSKNSNGWSVEFYMDIPSYCSDLERIVFDKTILKRTTLFFNGEVKNKFYSNFWSKYRIYNKNNKLLLNILIEESNHLLFDYVLETRVASIQWVNKSTLLSLLTQPIDLRPLSFYLSNPNLQEEVFYLWYLHDLNEYLDTSSNVHDVLDLISNHRNEKSVKRALYKHYLIALEKTYDPKFDFIMSRVIEDSNLLTTLLSLPPFHKREIFIRLSLINVERALSFILEFFTQKQLYTLIMSAVKTKENFQYFKDIIQMLSSENTLPIFLEHFTKERANIIMIHNSLIRIQNAFILPMRHKLQEESMHIDFEYQDIYFQAQGESNGLKFILPQSPNKLFHYAQELHNCMASYADSIKNNQLVIYVIFKDGKLLYAIEIRDNKIVQAKAAYNRFIPASDLKIIDQWYADIKSNYLKELQYQ